MPGWGHSGPDRHLRPRRHAHVTYVSEVHYVDPEHVALSFQFFNKTRQNVLANPRATVLVVHPVTAARYRLSLRYLRTETEGPLFESMKAKLAGIASHTGMSGVFRLLGSDLYRVLAIEHVDGQELPAPAPGPSLLAGVRACARRMGACTELAVLLDETLLALEKRLDIPHAMVLLLDPAEARLYTVASRGYPVSGVGSEIPLGAGVIGVAARERTPIRITHMTSEYAYGQAIRDSAARSGLASKLETEIPLPGLAEPRSQLAVPILFAGQLLGVLYAESAQDGRFGYDHEDALVIVASQLAAALHALQQAPEAQEDAPPARRRTPVKGTPVTIRHYPADHSVFIGEDYLIKGVAGAIFWKLVREHVGQGRTEFTNRELRLDPSIPLPALCENLEARLILLQRRLTERFPFLRIEKTGRGRFRLHVSRPIRLAGEAARSDVQRPEASGTPPPGTPGSPAGPV